ncbi:hypothetical protein TI05_10040, partial [Achromatium sp. WMS3]
FSVGLYLVLALITYDPQDPGWSYAIPNISNTKNAGGLVGAWCADLLVYLFGYLAFLFPITILWHSLLAFYKYNFSNKIYGFLLKWLGFVITLVAGSVLANLYIYGEFYRSITYIIRMPLGLGSGGILGDFLTPILLITISPLGVVLSLVLALLFGLTLLFRISWLNIMDALGAGVLFILWPFIFPFLWLFSPKAQLSTTENITEDGISMMDADIDSNITENVDTQSSIETPTTIEK